MLGIVWAEVSKIYVFIVAVCVLVDEGVSRGEQVGKIS